MKKRLFNALVICCMLAVLSIPVVFQANDDNALGRAGGKISNAIEDEEAGTILFSRGDIEVTKGELTSAIIGNMGRGKNQEEIVEDAVQTVVTRKYLYVKAAKAGVAVTEEEYEAYKEMLSESLQNADNKEDVQAYFDGFGGEDNYWKSMKPTILQNLTIRKYLNEQTGNESGAVGYSEKEIPAGTDKQQELETQIKAEAYEEALTVEEQEKLIDAAVELYQELQ
ncbi:MAG: hypothetical protein MR945_02320 [Agathobacter sp.]|nr:hypothetical protein [Agathobacter sp.]